MGQELLDIKYMNHYVRHDKLFWPHDLKVLTASISEIGYLIHCSRLGVCAVASISP